MIAVCQVPLLQNVLAGCPQSITQPCFGSLAWCSAWKWKAQQRQLKAQALWWNHTKQRCLHQVLLCNVSKDPSPQDCAQGAEAGFGVFVIKSRNHSITCVCWFPWQKGVWCKWQNKNYLRACEVFSVGKTFKLHSYSKVKEILQSQLMLPWISAKLRNEFMSFWGSLLTEHRGE